MLINRGCRGLLRGFGFFQDRAGQVIRRIEDMLLFNNIENLKQGSTVQSSQSYGVVMAIFEKFSLALMLGSSGESVNSVPNRLFLRGQKQYKVSDINATEGFPLDFNAKPSSKRTNPGKQIFTGNIYIDYFHPITCGQFLMTKDESLLRHLHGFQEIVVCSSRNLPLPSTAVHFFLEEGQASNLLLPKAALAHAYHLSKSAPTLLVVEDLYPHMLAHQQLQETILAQLHSSLTKTVYLSDYAKQLADFSGYRAGSNLAVLILQKNERDDLLSQELEKELDSLVSQTLAQDITLPSPLQRSLQSPFQYHIATLLYPILNEHRLKREEFVMKQKLKLHIDPWDFYAYFDSKPMLKMIDLYNKQEQNCRHEMAILCYWLVRAFRDETLAQLKPEPAKVLQDLLAFARTIREFTGKSLPELMREREAQIDPQEFKNEVLEHLARFYEMHSLHMRMSDQLLPFKRDYMQDQ